MPARPVSWRQRLAVLWSVWRPAPPTTNLRERVRVVGGALLGILLTALLCHALLPAEAVPWLVAPMGASAVLVFGVPASPLAQPWAVVGGNTLSALVGVACAQAIPHPAVAAACAVAGAIAVMFALRCLHPPGGAAALTAVLAAPALAPMGYAFAYEPVLLNALALTAFGVVYNTFTRHPYPHRQSTPAAVAGPARPGFTSNDLDAVLARHNGLIDMARDELEDLLHEAELQAHRRRLGVRLAGAVARADVPTVEFGTPLAEAWALMRPGGFKALAVVNRFQRVIGIITRADFLRLADLDVHEGFADRLRRRLRASGLSHSERPEVVGQIMQERPVCAQASAHALDLVPLFASSGHRHLPVVDARGVYQGMVAQADLIGALTDVLTDSAWDGATPPRAAPPANIL